MCKLTDEQINDYWRAGKTRNILLFVAFLFGICAYSLGTISILVHIPKGVAHILDVKP